MRLAEAATLVDAAETVLLKDCDEAMAIAAAARRPNSSIARAGGATAPTRLSLRRGRSISCSPATGGGAIHDAHPLQRALRDVHAANGHIGVSWELNGAHLWPRRARPRAGFPALAAAAVGALPLPGLTRF